VTALIECVTALKDVTADGKIADAVLIAILEMLLIRSDEMLHVFSQS
jgi:hypothetical protein